VDVNVNSTKKQVTLSYHDEALGRVERELRSLVQSTDQAIASASVQARQEAQVSLRNKKETSLLRLVFAQNQQLLAIESGAHSQGSSHRRPGALTGIDKTTRMSPL
jgi:DNA mismatch repair ATPase MutL